MRATGWMRRGATRLRQGWLLVAESTVAATVAWFIATRLVHHPQPFFAPAAALIVLGQARGQRVRRATEVVLGVAAGVLVADLVVQALGVRSTWTIFTVILLTLGLAVAVGASTVTVVQAAVSALYLVVVAPPTESVVPFRFVDALIGGGVALVASQLVVARNPLAPLARELQQMFAELAGVLEDIAAALDRHDEAAMRAALARARHTDAAVDRLRTAVAAAGEALRLDVQRQKRLGGVRAATVATREMDYGVRNVRVLARSGVTLIRRTSAPPELSAALRALLTAVRAVGDALAAELTGAGEAAQRHRAEAERAALAAVGTAGRLLADDPPLPLVMIIGQIRATAIDLLRGAGAEDDQVLGRVDEALGFPLA